MFFADLTNQQLIIQKAGVYAIHVVVSYLGDNNQVYTIALFVNNIDTDVKGVASNNSNETVQIAISEIYRFNEGDILDLRVKCSGANKRFDVKNTCLNLYIIGV